MGGETAKYSQMGDLKEMAKDETKTAGNAQADTTATETAKKKAIPRIVDSELEGPEPCVKVDVKLSSLDAALKFITRAFAAAAKEPYNGVTVQGILKVFPAGE